MRRATARNAARRLAPVISVAAVAMVCGSTAATAAASAIFVNTTSQGINEGGDCSLPEAIHAANFDTNVMPVPPFPGDFVTTGCTPGDGADTIQLLPGATFTMIQPFRDVNNYIGPTATPIVSSTITIEALGAKLVHGGGTVPYRAFAVGSNGSLTLREAHIKGFEVWGGDGRLGGGGGLGAGGAIYVEGGELTVQRSTFEQNGALGGDGASLPEAGAIAGGGGGGLGGNGGAAQDCGATPIGFGGGGGGGSRADGTDGCADESPTEGGPGGGRLASGPDPCGGDGGHGEEIVGGGGEDGECAGGGGGGGASASTAFDLAGTGGDGHYGGGGGGGGCCAGDGGSGGFGGGGGGSGITTSDEGGGGDGGDGGFGAGGGAGPDEPLTPGGGGQGGTFGGDAGLIHGGGGAGLGGAIFGHDATITVENSTFFNNYANRGHAGGPGGRDGRGAGGAIFLVGGFLSVVHSTLSGNATGEVNAEGEGLGGGGIVVYQSTDVTHPTFFGLRNSILAGNGIHECYLRNDPGRTTVGNLITDASAPAAVGGQTHEPCQANALAVDPGLEPLKITMPGRTPTMAIAPGSSAIDAAVSGGSVHADQRQVQRPVGFEDIGAFEYADQTPVTMTQLSPVTANGSNGWYTGDPVGVSITAEDDGAIDQTRCALDPVPPPATFDALPDLDCGITSVGTDGEHTVYAASRDTTGTTEGAPVTVSFKVDRTAPSLSPALSSSPVVVGQTGVIASANASDATSLVATSGCGPVDTTTVGPKTVTCDAADNAGNTSSAELGYLVEYRVFGFFDPVPGSKWKLSSTVPVKIALGGADGTRVPDAVGQALAADCRVTFSASGAQAKAAECMKYDPVKDQFVSGWKLGKIGTGAATLRVSIGYAGTTSTTEKTLPITITK